MNDQQLQVSSWINSFIARDMQEHVETIIKADDAKQSCKGKSSNEDRQ